MDPECDVETFSGLGRGMARTDAMQVAVATGDCRKGHLQNHNGIKTTLCADESIKYNIPNEQASGALSTCIRYVGLTNYEIYTGTYIYLTLR